MLDDIIHLLFCIVDREAEADRPVGRCERNAHGSEHMGGLQGAGGTGRPRRGTDAEIGKEQKDRFSLHVFKTDAHGVGKPVGLISVHQGVWNLFQDLLLEIIPQGPHPGIFVIEILFGQLAGLSKTDDIRDILRSSSSSLLLVAADQKWRKLCPFSNIEHADSLGRMELVAGEREHVDRRFSYVDRDLSSGSEPRRCGRGLPSPLRNLTDFFDRKDDPGLIIGVHRRNESRLIGDRLPQLIQIETPLPVDRKLGDVVALSG